MPGAGVAPYARDGQAEILARGYREPFADPDPISALLETPVNFDLGQRAAAMRLAASSDPKMRCAILKVFGWPGFLDPTTRPVLEALTQDCEEEIVAVANALAGEISEPV